MASIDRARSRPPVAKQPADPDRAPRRDTVEPRDAQHDLLLLQRTLGNQAVQRLVGDAAAAGPSSEPHADETDLDVTPEDEEGTRSEPVLQRGDTVVAPPPPRARPAAPRTADLSSRTPRDPAPASTPASRDATPGAGAPPAASTSPTRADHDPAVAPPPPRGRAQTTNPTTRPTPTPVGPDAGHQPAPVGPTAGSATPGPTVANVPSQVRSAADHDAGRRPADQSSDTQGSVDRPAGHLVNDDGAFATERGQMRKGEFLTLLRAGVLTTAEAALAGTGHSARECPWIEHWFAFYHQQDARHVERAIHKYAPETLSATTADEYIPHITERVQRALGTWVRAGQVTGVPDG